MMCACEGAIGGGSRGGDVFDGGPIDEPPIPGGSTDRDYEPLTPYPAAMMRLTQKQFRNSIEDVFDADAVPTGALPLDNVDEDFLSIGASFVSSSEGAVERYRDAAVEAAERILSNRDRFPVLRDCFPQSVLDPCVLDTVRHYAPKLWRRPVAEDEISRHAAIVTRRRRHARECGARTAVRAGLRSFTHRVSFTSRT